MGRRPPPSNRPIPIGRQVMQMGRDFPGFKYHRYGNTPTWHGILQPVDTPYSIRVVYRFAGRRSRAPKIWVESPTLHRNAKHRYSDGSLCLYYPRDGTWIPGKYISEVMIPLASLWLAFYEIWLVTGVWYGPEAPHLPSR